MSDSSSHLVLHNLFVTKFVVITLIFIIGFTVCSLCLGEPISKSLKANAQRKTTEALTSTDIATRQTQVAGQIKDNDRKSELAAQKQATDTNSFVTKTVGLDVQSLRRYKEKKCVLIHVWATWCLPCIEELPGYIKWVNSMLSRGLKLNPLTIDVSHKLQRDSFSKSFVLAQEPKFPVYFKLEGSIEEYIDAVDNSWQGELPYSVLFVSKTEAHRPLKTYLELESIINSMCQK